MLVAVWEHSPLVGLDLVEGPYAASLGCVVVPSLGGESDLSLSATKHLY